MQVPESTSTGGGISKSLMYLDSVKLGDLSQKLSENAEKFTTYNEEIYSKVASLASYWVGPDYDAFVADTNEFKPSLEALASLFGVYSTTVGTFGTDGESLISAIKSCLDCSDINVTLDESVYKAEDIGGPNTGYLGYGADTENVKTAKDAYNQAMDIQTKLYYDMEVISVEIRNEQNNLAALKQVGKMPDGQLTEAEYDKFEKDILDRIAKLEANYESYAETYNLVVDLTANKSADLLDLITNKEGDGLIRGASDGWFGINDNVNDAVEGLKQINAALSTLPPITTFVDSATVNGLLAYEEGYHMDSFMNGVNVTKNAMEIAYTLANNNNESMEVAPGVVLFNSRQFVIDGQAANNDFYGRTSHTFSQAEAYANYDGAGSGAETFDGGYDSVRYVNDDGETVYLTCAQFQKLGYTLPTGQMGSIEISEE